MPNVENFGAIEKSLQRIFADNAPFYLYVANLPWWVKKRTESGEDSRQMSDWKLLIQEKYLIVGISGLQHPRDGSGIDLMRPLGS